MAAKRWLTIIVDGNSPISPYWTQIVTQYIEKIVRTFLDNNSTEEGANHAQCEVALVMYNAKSEIGLTVQYIHWTRDADYFLGVLSCLAFNEDNRNQHTMVEGLAEALTLFPRPSEKMTTTEYYAGERHCILIPSRDPIPMKMFVCVPEIQGGFVGTKISTLKADFYEVAEMFGPLAVSLSIISPVQHPIFEAIFDMGNNEFPTTNTPTSRINGQLTVLLSKKFKEAHDAVCEIRTVDPFQPTNDVGLPIDFAMDNQGYHKDLFTISNILTGKQFMELANDDRLESVSPILPLVVPNVLTSEVGNISTPPAVVVPTNSTAVGGVDIVADPRNINIAPPAAANQNFMLPPQYSTGGNTFSVEPPAGYYYSSSEVGNISIPPVAVPTNSTAVGGVDNIVAEPRNINIAPPAAANQNFMLPEAQYSSGGNTFNVQPAAAYPSSSSLMLPYARGSGSSSIRPFHMVGFGPQGRLAIGPSTGVPHAPITPKFNPSDFWPPTPPLSADDNNHYAPEWEGSLVGKIQKNRPFTLWIKGFRKAATPMTLEIQWSRRLEIAQYLPEKSLNHTIKICQGPVDFVFLHLKQVHNLDLYDKLKNKNLCAKIILPMQILMIAPTESKYHYIGTVFPRETLFIEPVN